MDNAIEQRIKKKDLLKKVVKPETAVLGIENGMSIGVHGATFCGYPKVTIGALVERIKNEGNIKVQIWSASLVGKEIDGALASCNGISRRLGSHADTTLRGLINNRQVSCNDVRTEMLAQSVQRGIFGTLDLAIINAIAIDEDGGIIPSISPADAAYLAQAAKKIIVEIDHTQPLDLIGFHDIYVLPPPPNLPPIPLKRAGDRIGSYSIPVDISKIEYITESYIPQKLPPPKDIDNTSRAIASSLMEFLKKEVASGRLGNQLQPLESGLGGIADAVLRELGQSEFEDIEIFTAVLGDSALDLADKGKLKVASGCACFFSAEGWEKFFNDIEKYRNKIILRPVEITNSPELVYRLGVIGLNGAVEVDLYGHVNSSHVMGSKLLAGVGGVGVFANNASISIFLLTSTSMGGKISSVVPMVPHVDVTEHNVDVVVTEQGYADLRGLAPHERAKLIIERCAHPDYRPLLIDYYDEAEKTIGGHEPHILKRAFSFHNRFIETGSMKPIS